MPMRFGVEVMQTHKTLNYGGERGWNFGIALIGPVVLAIHEILMHLRVKCLFEEPCCPRELDEQAAFRHIVNPEAVGLQPPRQGARVLSRRTELLSELLRRQPAMVAGRSMVLLVFEQPVERLLLLGGPLKQQQ